MIDNEITKTIIFLSDTSQPAVSRYIAARMIGIVSEVLCSFKIYINPKRKLS